MAGHSLVRFKGTLVNTPHLIDQTSFSTIMDYIDRRIEGNADINPKMWDDDDDYIPVVRTPSYNEDTKVGVLSIDGPLTYRATGWEMFCGGTSYQALKEDMEYLVGQGAKTVVLSANSGGGEAFAVFDTANYIKSLAKSNGIKLIAFVDGMAASACYALVSIADEIVVSTDSQVGSIGVLVQLMNDSKHLEKEGYERVFVTAGASKIPFAEDGSFRKEFLEKLQTDINECYEKFTGHVAEHRGISQASVKATEAEVFKADEALTLGLIDKVMTVEEFYDYLGDYAASNVEEKEMVANPLKKMFTKKEDKTEMAQLETLQAQLLAKDAELAQTLEAVSALQASLEAVQAQLTANESLVAQAQEALAKAEADSIKAKLDARKTQLSAVLNADQVDAQFDALSSLDDAAFNAVVGQYEAMKAARAESFVELGSEGVESEEATTVPVDSRLKASIEQARQRWAKN